MSTPWGQAHHWKYKTCYACQREFPRLPAGLEGRGSVEKVRSDETYLLECPWCGTRNGAKPMNGLFFLERGPWEQPADFIQKEAAITISATDDYEAWAEGLLVSFRWAK